MLDGVGGRTLTLRQLRIIGSGGDDTAVVIVGNRAGVSVQGGSGGDIAADIAGSIARADSLATAELRPSGMNRRPAIRWPEVSGVILMRRSAE